jgi:hypothetical protein
MGDVKILCPMGGGQWQVMHFIQKGIEEKISCYLGQAGLFHF